MKKITRLGKKEIINSLEALTKELGFLYSLVIVLGQDLFLNPEESADINWYERISFQEASFLIGLLVKNKIDLSVIPTEKTSKHQVEIMYSLFKELHEAHNLPIIEKMFKGTNRTLTQKEGEKEYNDLFGKGEFMTEPIFYGGSGAYDFQYLEFASKRYQEDNCWLTDNKGVSIEEMAAITAGLKKIQEGKFHNLKKVKTFEDFCKSLLSVFCFSCEDLNNFNKNTLENFIKAFSIVPGTVNRNLDSPGSYNAVNSHPIIILGNNYYFLPVGFCLSQSIYESPFYWMSSDNKYKDVAFKHRGETTEIIACEMLESVFGKSNVYKDIKVYKDKNKKVALTDIDVLAVFGNKSVIVQAKSKKLTELSRKGDEGKLRADFQESIQIAYEQGLICRKAVINKSNTLVTEHGTELQLQECIDDAYVICLTTDHYPAINHQLEVYLQKESNDPYPLAMSIFDLDIVTYYLKDPFELLYYLRQRVKFSAHFKANSEISLLGFHLKHKLYPSPNINGELLDEGFAQLVDANFPAMRGHCRKTSAIEKLYHKWKNEKFQQIIEQVKNTGEPSFTDTLFFLYDLAGSGADKLIETIEITKEKVKNDRRQHDFSMIFNGGESGVTFICLLKNSPEKFNSKLMSLAIARKYKTKANLWLALGSLVQSPNLIDAIAFNKQPWEEDEELEKFTEIVLKSGTSISPFGEKIGRNDPCPCGSGKKFGECCDK